MGEKNIGGLYPFARDIFLRMGVDPEAALTRLEKVPLSLHCWQGDDVTGFEYRASASSGGIAVTGHYPGRARNAAELRQDIKEALRLIPGRHRLNLHAMYGEFGDGKPDRDRIEPAHFTGWADWAEAEGLHLDFNATCFAHPMADSGYTLSSGDGRIREFWIAHVKQCRKISAWLGKRQSDCCLHNLWIPDGSKDTPADRWSPRRRLAESLDTLFEEGYPRSEMTDSLESKLFGIGSESYVVGSHDFYTGYAMTRGKMLCLDMGHFHPTESVADKISAILPFSKGLVLHVSRGVRWDSDHVAVLNDELRTLAIELVASGRLEDIRIALDFFDATIHRVGAWVIGARSMQKALLWALLQPYETLGEAEASGNLTRRLVLMEAVKTLPFGAVWDEFCRRMAAVEETGLMAEIEGYERDVTSKRK